MNKERNSLRPDIYFDVKDWMFKKLKLNNGLLLTFAYIYACTKLKLKVSVADVCRVLHVEPRTGRDRLKKLFDMGYVQGKKIGQQGASKYVYEANTEWVYKLSFNLNN